MFGVDIIPERILPAPGEIWIFHLGDFDKRKRFDQKAYKLPTSDPGSCTGRDTQTTFGTTAQAFIQKKRVIITPIIQTFCAFCEDYQTFHGPCPPPQPVSIQIRLSQTTSQILLPDPPVVETTSQIHLPDPPEQTTSQILLPDPPEQTDNI
ncbi:hypothetical protein TNCV_2247051 [Trichonephila clavipes]|nr:hypothetical protein TNCV_2247051 [Trichonephila clavipes]